MSEANRPPSNGPRAKRIKKEEEKNRIMNLLVDVILSCRYNVRELPWLGIFDLGDVRDPKDQVFIVQQYNKLVELGIDPVNYEYRKRLMEQMITNSELFPFGHDFWRALCEVNRSKNEMPSWDGDDKPLSLIDGFGIDAKNGLKTKALKRKEAIVTRESEVIKQQLNESEDQDEETKLRRTLDSTSRTISAINRKLRDYSVKTEPFYAKLRCPRPTPRLESYNLANKSETARKWEVGDSVAIFFEKQSSGTLTCGYHAANNALGVPFVSPSMYFYCLGLIEEWGPKETVAETKRTYNYDILSNEVASMCRRVSDEESKEMSRDAPGSIDVTNKLPMPDLLIVDLLLKKKGIDLLTFSVVKDTETLSWFESPYVLSFLKFSRCFFLLKGANTACGHYVAFLYFPGGIFPQKTIRKYGVEELAFKIRFSWYVVDSIPTKTQGQGSMEHLRRYSSLSDAISQNLTDNDQYILSVPLLPPVTRVDQPEGGSLKAYSIMQAMENLCKISAARYEPEASKALDIALSPAELHNILKETVGYKENPEWCKRGPMSSHNIVNEISKKVLYALDGVKNLKRTIVTKLNNAIGFEVRELFREPGFGTKAARWGYYSHWFNQHKEIYESDYLGHEQRDELRDEILTSVKAFGSDTLSDYLKSACNGALPYLGNPCEIKVVFLCLVVLELYVNPAFLTRDTDEDHEIVDIFEEISTMCFGIERILSFVSKPISDRRELDELLSNFADSSGALLTGKNAIVASRRAYQRFGVGTVDGTENHDELMGLVVDYVHRNSKAIMDHSKRIARIGIHLATSLEYIRLNASEQSRDSMPRNPSHFSEIGFDGEEEAKGMEEVEAYFAYDGSKAIRDYASRFFPGGDDWELVGAPTIVTRLFESLISDPEAHSKYFRPNPLRPSIPGEIEKLGRECAERVGNPRDIRSYSMSMVFKTDLMKRFRPIKTELLDIASELEILEYHETAKKARSIVESLDSVQRRTGEINFAQYNEALASLRTGVSEVISQLDEEQTREKRLLKRLYEIVNVSSDRNRSMFDYDYDPRKRVALPNHTTFFSENPWEETSSVV